MSLGNPDLDDTLTDITGRTWPLARQMIEVLPNSLANKDLLSSKTFEKVYLITFTDSTSNHSNLYY